jgi:hypothetical protein
MAFRDLLLTLATYSEPTSVSAVETSICFAGALGAKISAIAFEIKFQMPWSPFYKAFPDIPALAAGEEKRVMPTLKVSWRPLRTVLKRRDFFRRFSPSNARSLKFLKS